MYFFYYYILCHLVTVILHAKRSLCLDEKWCVRYDFYMRFFFIIKNVLKNETMRKHTSDEANNLKKLPQGSFNNSFN